MKIISPRAFDPAMITSNIPITEALWVANTYPRGQRRYVLPSYDLYEVVVDSTADEPTAGAAKEVKTWAKVGKVNAYACFDNVLQNPTIAPSGFDITFAPVGEVSSGIALLNATGGAVRVTVTDPTDGVVYDQSLNLVDNSNLTDWPDLFWAPYILRQDVVALDLPFYTTASVRIRIDEAATVGEVVLGSVTDLGRLRWRPTVGIIDYSQKNTDIFGHTSFIPRGYAKRANFTVNIPTAQVDHVLNTLAKRRAIPTVYIGNDRFGSTIIYGKYRDMTETIAGPNASEYVIELEGLV